MRHGMRLIALLVRQRVFITDDPVFKIKIIQSVAFVRNFFYRQLFLGDNYFKSILK